MAEWTWDRKRLHAAVLVAADELRDEDIALHVGIGKRTLERWKNVPEFRQHVEELLERWAEKLAKHTITDRQCRLRRLQKRYDQIDNLITARGEDLAGKVAGGETGLLAHDVKSIGSGRDAETVDVYRADTALIKEERELAKQAAIESGQWQEKDNTFDGAKRIILEFD